MPSIVASHPKPSLGLVLSGGGARGAYQAGVLKAAGMIADGAGLEWPFEVLSGLSAGAINCAYLASSLRAIDLTVQGLSEVWSEISANKVFRTDPASLSYIGARWITALVSGGMALSKEPQSLVDTRPLRNLISKHANADAIDENIARGRLRGVSVSATEYATSRGISFVHGGADIEIWAGARSAAVAQRLTPDHVMASSAIPLLFPAVKIGKRYYGDGCLRNLTPLLPAIRMGATHLFVIGVRREMRLDDIRNPDKEGASAARIFSVLLNAVLMDGLESDLSNLDAINKLVIGHPASGSQFRHIPIMMIRPSKDISEIAMEFEGSIPPFIRFLTHGLGPIEHAAEMVSYLLFEPEFCRAQIELGYRDAMNQSVAISDFLKSVQEESSGF